MKRSAAGDGDISGEKNLKNKKVRFEDDNEEEEEESEFMKLDENLLYEVLKHVDARTLAVASCVSKIWHRTAQDERLWELICTRHWNNINYGTLQLRSVVLALGGFQRLHSLYVSKTPASSSAPPPFPASLTAAKGSKRWGKDEVNLSLSLLSVRHFGMMNFTKTSK